MRLPAIFLAAVFSSAPAAAFAASATTIGFVDEVRVAVACLAPSSALAADRSRRPAVRALARSVADEASVLAGALAEWRRGREAAEVAAENSPSIDHLGPVFGVTRRLALGADSAPQNASVVVDLQGLKSEVFDARYEAIESACLASLIAGYKSFILNGDDDVLRALAVHRLNKARSLLARVRRIPRVPRTR